MFKEEKDNTYSSYSTLSVEFHKAFLQFFLRIFRASYKTQNRCKTALCKVCISLVCVPLFAAHLISCLERGLYFDGQAANNRFLSCDYIYTGPEWCANVGWASCLWFRRALPVFITAGSERPDPLLHPSLLSKYFIGMKTQSKVRKTRQFYMLNNHINNYISARMLQGSW